MREMRVFSKMISIFTHHQDLTCMDFTLFHRELNDTGRIMTQKTAILLGRKDLFQDGMERLLARMKNWSVTILSNENPTADLIQEIGKVKPDIVLINLSDEYCELDLPCQLIKSHPNLNVITISSESNLVEIYSKREILIKGSADLLSIIDQSQMIPSWKGGDLQNN